MWLFRLARALAPGYVHDDGDLDYLVGDIIAIVAENQYHQPRLGMLLDESRRHPGRYRLRAHAKSLSRIPTCDDLPEVEFLNKHTPILYYGEWVSNHLRVL